LELIAGTVDLARAEMNDRSQFSRILDAHVPEHWPPPLDDADTVAFHLERLEACPDEAGWRYWYIALRDDATGERVLVGSVELKGKPTFDGTVEIGYSVLKEAQGLGYATEAVKGLFPGRLSTLRLCG
jgi:RimJ/RimL family protein N-acetyltransferase